MRISMSGLRTPVMILEIFSWDSLVAPSPSDSRHGNTVSMPPASMSSGRILSSTFGVSPPFPGERVRKIVSPLNLGVQPDVHSTAVGPSEVCTTGFHGFLIRPPMNATSVPTPNAPRPTPSDVMISLRRGNVEVSRVSDSSATIVLRSTSDDCPSWRSWTAISSGMNFFWNSTAPIPIDRIDSPNVSPYSGVASVYHRLPGAPSGFHSHGQNKKISTRDNPENPRSRD